MRYLLAALCAAVLVMLMPGVANASCAPIPGDRDARLAHIAAGGGENDVAFIGTVIKRGKAFERSDSVWSPIVFHVIATFKGAALRERTVLTNGGCINGSCVSNSETPSYGGKHLQLVLADRQQHVGLVSVNDCSDAGPLGASEVAVMLHPSTLPMTGVPGLTGVAGVGIGTLLLGCGLMVCGRPAQRVRLMVAEPTTTSPSYSTTV